VNWLDLMTGAAFVGSFLIVLLFGLVVVNARRRVRNIADVERRISRQRPGRLRVALAGAVPLGEAAVDSLQQDLKRAGFYGPNAMVEFLATRNLLLIAAIMIGGGLAVGVDPGSTLPKTILMVTGVVAVLIYAVPRWLLHVQAHGRLGRIQRGLPDALDIIRMCLTGGLPLRDSLQRVSQEVDFFHPDVAVELEIVRRHAEADTMAKALKEFARRMNAPDVNALASLVSQTEKTGTHVATAVTEFADGIRRQFRQRAEERASKTTIRMLFPVIFCLAPPVFILLLGPPVLQLRNFVKEAHAPGGVLNASTYETLQTETGNGPAQPGN
jgi:tight adherence protein C